MRRIKNNITKFELLLLLVWSVLFVLTGCDKSVTNSDLELSFLNNEVVGYSNNIDKDSINIIYYSLKNNSSKTYFINNLTEQKELSKKSVYKNGINLHVYNDKNVELKYERKRLLNGDSEVETTVHFMIKDFIVNEKRLNNNYKPKYFGLYARNNIFFIHPNETIFFKYTINLNRPVSFDGVREGYVSLNKGQKYYAKMTISSDSLNYKYVLPGDILNTIKENNVKVYHGILESKNSVPIKVIE